MRNEDITRPTYGDAAFDLVLSSDTLEHVPDFPVALRDTRRVLRPGHHHLFTVPIVASRPTTQACASIGPEGELVHQLPPLYHGRGAGIYRYVPVGADLLTFTEFGRDLVEHIRDAGLEPKVFEGEGDAKGAEMVFSGRAPGRQRPGRRRRATAGRPDASPPSRPCARPASCSPPSSSGTQAITPSS